MLLKHWLYTSLTYILPQRRINFEYHLGINWTKKDTIPAFNCLYGTSVNKYIYLATAKI